MKLTSRILRALSAALFVAALAIGTTSSSFALDYDLVINNGRVMDPETMYDGIANVGVKDGKIAAITKDKISGKETINAKGLVVAPGFIDTHYHAVDPFGVRMALRDGVTTGMDLEQGATSIAKWYEAKAKTGWPINYGTTYMMIGARMMVHDPEVKTELPIEVPNMDQFINESAKDGVPGWSVTRSDDNFVRVWDAATAEVVTPKLRQAGYVRQACMRANNRLVLGCDPNLLIA